MSTLPPLPPVPNHGRGPIKTDIAYSGPVLVQTKLGNIPEDYRSSSGWVDHDHVSCDNGACTTGGHEVWEPMPVLDASGQLKMETDTAHIDARARSIPAYTFGYGALGGAVGAGLGAAITAFAGGPIGLVAGVAGAAGALLLGGIAGHYAAGDKIELQWQEKPINQKTLTGYDESTRELTHEECTWWDGHRECHQVTDGYEHEFTADVQDTKIGSYWEPVVIHSR